MSDIWVVRRKDMETAETTRLTIRLPTRYVHLIDTFIRLGEFSSRSEVMRRALIDFVANYANDLLEKADKLKKIQELEQAVSVLDSLAKR